VVNFFRSNFAHGQADFGLLLDTTDFSRVVLQFQPKSQRADFPDTTGFSRVVLQFQPNDAAKRLSDQQSTIARIEEPVVSEGLRSGFVRLKLKLHAAEAGGVRGKLRSGFGRLKNLELNPLRELLKFSDCRRVIS